MSEDEDFDRLMDVLRRMCQDMRERLTVAVIEEAERDLAASPATAAKDAPPAPLTIHPYYRRDDRMWLVDWLNDEAHPFGNYVRLPMPAPAAPTEQKCLLLTRQRAYGFAPYVGRPFVYVWNAASDQHGRWVAGERRIAYLDGQS